MAPTKTYLQAPNFRTKPTAFPRIGSIIEDPFDPLRKLADPKGVPETETHRESLEETSSSKTNVHANICLQIIQIASAKISGSSDHTQTTKYTANVLETRYLKRHPTDEEATARAAEPAVKKVMDSGMVKQKTVYMISGIMVVKGRKKTITVGQDTRGNASVKVPTPAQATVGAGVGGQHTTSNQTHTETKGDVVFAYQLHKIEPKGVFDKELKIKVYKPSKSQGFQGKKDEGPEFEAAPAGEETFGEQVTTKSTGMVIGKNKEEIVLITKEQQN